MKVGSAYSGGGENQKREEGKKSARMMGPIFMKSTGQGGKKQWEDREGRGSDPGVAEGSTCEKGSRAKGGNEKIK